MRKLRSQSSEPSSAKHQPAGRAAGHVMPQIPQRIRRPQRLGRNQLRHLELAGIEVGRFEIEQPPDDGDVFRVGLALRAPGGQPNDLAAGVFIQAEADLFLGPFLLLGLRVSPVSASASMRTSSAVSSSDRSSRSRRQSARTLSSVENSADNAALRTGPGRPLLDQLVEKNLQDVEGVVAQADVRALIAVQIEHHGGVLVGLAGQISSNPGSA